MSSSNYDKST